jgi:hypothetical protein
VTGVLGGRGTGACGVRRADVAGSLGRAPRLGGSFGAQQARTGQRFPGSVDLGWRVELFPSRVGMRGCVHLNEPRAER